MTKGKSIVRLADVKALLAADPDVLRPLVQAVLQELLEAEMSAALAAGKGERTPDRLGYRSGYHGRTLVTRVGKLELRVPQDRHGRFSTELFERRTHPQAFASGPRRRWSRRSPRCTSRASPHGRSRRSPRSCAVTASRPQPSARSTFGSTRAWRSSPAGGSSMPVPT